MTTTDRHDAQYDSKHDSKHDAKHHSKYDIKKAHKRLYAPGSADFTLAEVPPMDYIAVDGSGDPNTAAAYPAAVQALFGTAYTLKRTSKVDLGRDFVVAPLEGLWHADDPSVFTERVKSAWSWTMLIALPDWIGADMVAAAAAAAAAQRPGAFDLVRPLTLTEGLSAQILHIGPYDDEGPTLDRLHRVFMPEHGLAFNGVHHEIYLSDPRRADPARLKTVLRQPVRREHPA
ncbi:hypothetical protein CLV63_13624 [Murinocardiopsis flavida]|uniref:GyrI-like small molecule binding domain-containing protein n=1 Tax=Murinocardiopsis flavida TaxID=645275 RepID=A0A2P8CMQ2_9ACTN|nr:GyrI-like domain-containing protein [Murinocardiopsis flavida]PSK86223.1 hypothetical protein CLV63_13624 [Murinocardiopsis flavida]